jgi:hypothetical protein
MAGAIKVKYAPTPLEQPINSVVTLAPEPGTPVKEKEFGERMFAELKAVSCVKDKPHVP